MTDNCLIFALLCLTGLVVILANTGGVMPKKPHEHEENHELKLLEKLVEGQNQIFIGLERIEQATNQLERKIDRLVRFLHPRTRGFTITQGDHMPITGIPVGGSGHFVATPSPAGAVLPAGNIPAWSANDGTVSLAPSADGLSVDASVPNGSALTSVDLTILAQPLADGSQPSGTVTVPVIQSAPQVSSFQIDQTS